MQGKLEFLPVPELLPKTKVNNKLKRIRVIHSRMGGLGGGGVGDSSQEGRNP